MLTGNDDSGQGGSRNFVTARRRGRPGTNNDKLIKVLEKYKGKNPDDISFWGIKKYFEGEGIEVRLHNIKFRPESRDKYFSKLLEKHEILCNTLIFIDPDIGLGANKLSQKHVMYEELSRIYKDLNKESMLMIFQYLPYRLSMKDKVNATKRRCKNLKEELKLNYLPSYILDGDISFLFLNKKVGERRRLGDILSEYRKRYRKFPNMGLGNITCK
jgi:hypothetical protein